MNMMIKNSILFSCSVILVWFSGKSFVVVVDGYKNYTVGDSLGWYDTLQKPTLNYQEWVAAKTFSLGDFLIFNTDTNHSVVQTYNLTTYTLCDYEDAQDNDTIQWSSADPSNTSPHDVTVAVPLVKEGMTFFFSGDYDGEQCKNGQHLKINVSRGQGLPKSLQTPTTTGNQSPGPASGPQSGNDEDSVPDTIVPSNFDHPHADDETDEPSGSSSSGCLSISVKHGKIFTRVFVLFGLLAYSCL